MCAASRSSVARSGRGAPAGGIMPGAQLAHRLFPGDGAARRPARRRAPASDRPPARTRSLWHVAQYCSTTFCGGGAARAARRPALPTAASDDQDRTAAATATPSSSRRRPASRAARSSPACAPRRRRPGTRPRPSASPSRPSLSLTSSRAPLLDQQLDDVVRAAVGRAEKRRQPHRVGRVHVGAQLQAQLHRLQPRLRRFGVGLRHHPVHARGRHQRRGARRGREVRVGAVLQQQPHRGRVGRERRAQERRLAGEVHPRHVVERVEPAAAGRHLARADVRRWRPCRAAA